MDLIGKINRCRTMNQLDNLRNEIAVAGRDGEIQDFPALKKAFVEKKANLKLLREKNWGYEK